jgi:hypothetical protein
MVMISFFLAPVPGYLVAPEPFRHHEKQRHRFGLATHFSS